ncbi:MAG: protein kinase domain-containing protein [Pseudomarimonas sp.]
MTPTATPAIPGYRLLRELGRGGMATVYLAVQESLGREVALKLLAPHLAADPEAAARFLREGRIAAKLVHRHIVGIHDVGVHAGQPCIAMESLPGGHIRIDGALEPGAALRIVHEIALALDHAHREGVIHRDIKPENILRRADGSHALSDFGIARTLDAGPTLTQEGIALGTPHYMSPEQLQALPLDGRSDLYSLGVVLFQLLTGQLPYRGTDGVPVGMQHIHAPIPSLPAHLSRYQALLDSLLAKSPGQRPARGADLAARIEALQSGNVAAILTQPMTTMRRPSKRWLGLAALLFAAAVGVVWLPGLSRKAEPASAGPATLANASDGGQISTESAENGIAVLPLLNIGGNPAHEYFSDGLAETLLDMLSGVPELKVIARSSSFAFKGKSTDAREIARVLDVAYLLEGSVQHAEGKVRITMQLVRADDGVQLWSQRYDRALADVFVVQDEIATSVVAKILGNISNASIAQQPALRAGGATSELSAYEEYLKGNALLTRRKSDELRQALHHFERAIELDPGFARAHAAAAATLSLLGDGPNGQERRQRYVKRALELDPELGEAHIQQARLLAEARDLAGANRAYQRGIELAPNYAQGILSYAQFLTGYLGQPELALPQTRRALLLDPLAFVARLSYGRYLWELGQHEESARQMERALADFPDSPTTHFMHAWLSRDRGDLVAALRELDRAIAADSASAPLRVSRCKMLLESGAEAIAERCLERVVAEFGESSDSLSLRSWLAVVRGDFAGALAHVESPGPENGWERAWMLGWNARYADAVEAYLALQPRLLAQPLGQPPLGQARLHIRIGDALAGNGAPAQAEALFRYALPIVAARPNFGGFFGRNFDEVHLHARLGNPDEACVAMRRVHAAGFVDGYRLLAVDPGLAELRKQSCFSDAYTQLQALAESRIQNLRDAGLLVLD